jgi:hypothetical protein
MTRSIRPTALLQCALLLLLGVHCVTAGYTPCSDPATCGDAGGCCTQYNNVNYCCPGSGNSLDFNTLQCANYAQCGQSCSQLYNRRRLPRPTALS